MPNSNHCLCVASASPLPLERNGRGCCPPSSRRPARGRCLERRRPGGAVSAAGRFAAARFAWVSLVLVVACSSSGGKPPSGTGGATDGGADTIASSGGAAGNASTGGRGGASALGGQGGLGGVG